MHRCAHVRITNTRPDLVKSVCYLACFVENPGISHKTALERVLRYLSSSTDKGIKYQSPTNGGGGTRTTALRLHRRRLRWRPSHVQEHIWIHLHSGMRTCELCPRLVFAQTNSRFSFNHRSGTLRCWTWRYRRHLGKIAANRTENDSAMQWLTIPITIQTDSQSAKALAEGSGYTGGLRHVAVQFRSRPIRSRTGRIRMDQIEDQLADMLG